MLILTSHPISVQCSSFTDTEHSGFPSDVSLLSLATSKSRFCSRGSAVPGEAPSRTQTMPRVGSGLPLPTLELGIQGTTQGPSKGTCQVL